MATNDEIKEHLDHILTEVARTQNIENYEVSPNTTANYGDGYIAQFFTGEIQDKDTENTISVAIKKAPIFEFDYKALFANEQLFYATVFPALDQLQKENKVLKSFDNVPSYFSGSTTEPNKEYIAMENLKPLGYVMSNKGKCFDQEHLELIFTTYAKFHALSFVLRKKNFTKYENVTKDITDPSSSFLSVIGKQIITAVSAAVKALDEEEDKILCDELRDFGENAAATFTNSFKYNGENRCFIHGDCWSNNMLFKYSEAGKPLDVKLLDFQICRDGSPIHDLSYFFYSGASKKDFDNIEFYLQLYYKSLVEFAKELGTNPDELFSFEILVKEWKENALLGVIFSVWIWQVKLTSKEDFNEFMQEIKGVSDEDMVPLYATFLEKTFNSSAFKDNTKFILAHAFDYGVLDKNKIIRK